MRRSCWATIPSRSTRFSVANTWCGCAAARWRSTQPSHSAWSEAQQLAVPLSPSASVPSATRRWLRSCSASLSPGLRGLERGCRAGGHWGRGWGGAILPLTERQQAQCLPDDIAVVKIAAGGDRLLDEGVQSLGELD